MIAPAHRAALLVDAADYFLRLENLLSRAERSILIIGWDFDGGICLHAAPAKPRETLGGFLRRLVETRPGLEIRILVWSLSLLHAPGDPLPKLFGGGWQEHPRLHLRLDREHPLYACHHQKIVAIDDTAAFVGGIDLTVGRRDTRGHLAHARKRRNPDGTPYGPVHDMQMLVEGPAAHAVANVARERWRVATGERLAAVPARTALWPPHLKADFITPRVAVSRTAPAWQGRAPVREGLTLIGDMLKAARDYIYIEAQYFTGDFLAELLTPILLRPGGPEIVLVLTAEWHGQIERFVLSRNRDRLLRRLRRADRHGRLRAFHPQVPAAEGSCAVLVHAKLIAIDDRLLRVGSSNLNNRSTGLDTECDLAIEAASPEERLAIANIRDRLIAEHLGVAREAVSETFAKTGSLIATIETLNNGPRRLKAFEIAEHGPVRPVFGTGLIDPKRPLRLLGGLRRPLPRRLRSA